MAVNKNVNVTLNLKDKLSNKARGAGKSMKGFAKSVIPGRIALAAFTAVVGVAIRDFAKFQSKMVDVGNLFGGTTKEVKKLSRGVMEISSMLPVATQDLANSLFDVVSADVAVGDSLEFLEASARLAVAGVTDTKTAVDGLTSVMNAYGLEAGDVTSISDKLFATQKAGKTTIAELSSSIGQVGMISKQAGISMDEMLASIATITKTGTNTAMTVNKLKTAIMGILSPTEESKKQASLLGLEFNATALKAKGLSGFLKEVMEKTGGNTDAMKKLFGSSEALTGVLAIARNGFEDLDKVLGDVETSADDTEKALDQLMSTITSQTKVMGNNIANISKGLVADREKSIVFYMKGINWLLKGISNAFNMESRLDRKIRLALEAQALGLNKVADAHVLLYKQKAELDAADATRTAKLEAEARSKKMEGMAIEAEADTNNLEGKKIAYIRYLESISELDTIKAEERQAIQEELREQYIIYHDEKREMDLANLEQDLADEDLHKVKKMEAHIKYLKHILKSDKLSAKQRQEINTTLHKSEIRLEDEKKKNFDDTLGHISTLMKSSNKELFMVGQAAAIAQATMNTYEAVTKAMTSTPWPLNMVFAAGALAAGLLAVSQISSQKPPSFQEGGIVGGSQEFGDNINARVNSGEMILNKEQQTNLLDMINSGGDTEDTGGGGGGDIHITLEIDGEAIARAIAPHTDGARAQFERGNI